MPGHPLSRSINPLFSDLSLLPSRANQLVVHSHYFATAFLYLISSSLQWTFQSARVINRVLHRSFNWTSMKYDSLKAFRVLSIMTFDNEMVRRVGSWEFSPQGDDWEIQLSRSNDGKMWADDGKKAAVAKRKIRLIFNLILASLKLV